MEQEVADLKEAEQSGGIPLSHCGRSITREESLQAELDEQVQRGEQQSRLLSDLQAQLVLANQQAWALAGRSGTLKPRQEASNQQPASISPPYCVGNGDARYPSASRVYR